MKILWLSHLVPYPPKAGVLLRAHYLIRELCKYHDVDLLAFNQRALIEPYFSSYEEGTEIARRQLQSCCGRVEFVDCPVDRSPYGKHLCALKSLVSSYPYNVNWLQDPDFQNLVTGWHKQSHYDLIHCDTISLAPYVSDIDHCLLSLDHHNVESHMLLRRSQLESNPLKKFYFWQEGMRLQHYEEQVCLQFDTNITCSELDSKRLAAICPSAEFTEIPNGVDTDLFTPGSGESEPATLIFIGTLDWYPNTRAVRYLAYEIWPRIKAKVPDVKVNIIGAGAPADLMELSEREANFNVLGFVDDLKPYLDSATVYVCPIDDGGGTKLKLLDAFSAGKAVVAHQVACEGLRVEDGAQVLLADDPDTYVEKIQSLLSNPELRHKLQNNARKHVEELFSFASIGLKLSKHFSELLNGRATVTQKAHPQQ